MDLKPQTYKYKYGIIALQYNGKTVFKDIMPFLDKYLDWLFWKKNPFL